MLLMAAGVVFERHFVRHTVFDFLDIITRFFSMKNRKHNFYKNNFENLPSTLLQPIHQKTSATVQF